MNIESQKRHVDYKFIIVDNEPSIVISPTVISTQTNMFQKKYLEYHPSCKICCNKFVVVFLKI